MNVSGLFAIGDHLRRLSETGDPFEALGRIIDFEAFGAPDLPRATSLDGIAASEILGSHAHGAD